MTELKEKAQYILSLLKERGADDAAVSVSSGSMFEFNVDAGEFSLIRSTFSSAASMKALIDKRKGTGSVNSLDEEDLIKAADECIISAEAGMKDEANSVAEKIENCDFADGALKPDKETFFDSVITFLNKIKTEFPKVMVEQLIASYSSGKSVFANSNGVEFTSVDGAYSVGVMYSAHDDGKTGSFNSFDVDFTDPETDIMSLDSVRLMFERAVRELDVVDFGEKAVCTAVVAPCCLGDFTDIISSFVSDYALIEKTSPWKDKLGQKVAGDAFTLSVIPLDERIVCGERYTAEGYRSENFDIIKNGVLESFCLSEYGARRTGLTRAKSLSGAIEVRAGDKNISEIIAGIDKGILVCRFSGGEPANNGDFSGVAKNSFLIENGEIRGGLTETMISGNFIEMLNDIKGISSETVNDGSSVLPYVAFGSVTVS